MGKQTILAWEKVSLDEFNDALEKYAPLIEDLSASKGGMLCYSTVDWT